MENTEELTPVILVGSKRFNEDWHKIHYVRVNKCGPGDACKLFLACTGRHVSFVQPVGAFEHTVWCAHCVRKFGLPND